MIVSLLLAGAAGPGLRLGAPNADGTPVVLALDRDGRIATQITCPPNSWTDPRDSAAALIASTTVMATVIATNGRLTSIDQLGPARYTCVFVAPDPKLTRRD